jgi:Transmembrane family 220, helix
VPTARRLLGGLGFALFAFAASLQLNDPDPLAWVAIYGAAAAVWGWVALGRRARVAAVVVAGISGVWSALLARGVVGQVDWRHLFDEFSMQGDARVEEAREMLGLAIVAVAMVAAALGKKGDRLLFRQGSTSGRGSEK